MSEAIEQTKNNLDLDNPLIRILLAGFISVFTTFAILWVMQILIATGVKIPLLKRMIFALLILSE